MKNKSKFFILVFISIFTIIIGTGIGSVFISPKLVASIIFSKVFNTTIKYNITPIQQTMILNMRLPRVLMAFLTGASLSVSGTVMQSLLRNPLASPFGLGISSGAGLGVCIMLLLSFYGSILTPIVSLLFALGTVIIVIGLSSKIDKNFSNTTIILTGMVISLFLNAVMSFLSTLSPTMAQQITLWMLGSFSAKTWNQVLVLAPVTFIGIIVFCRYSKEMDIISFGETTAITLGVSLKKMKWILILFVSILTGTTTSFVGVIGFIDLIAPHIVRLIFGASHRYIIPASALFGGSFMVLCDLGARTLTSPREIPIGSITALIGAPFFLYIYFNERSNKLTC